VQGAKQIRILHPGALDVTIEDVCHKANEGPVICCGNELCRTQRSGDW
jgi:hypothetical protein